MKIHRTAIVSPEATIGEGVEIGPYALVEGSAIIGPGCVIQAHAIISSSVQMGENNVIGYGAVIGGDPQDHAFSPDIKSRVVIGSRNRIREYCTIHRGTAEGSETAVGDHNYFMAGSHLAHNARVGSHVTLANNVLLAGHVEIQDRVYVGGGSVFHQFIRVGELCLIQGNSKFSKDIPPFTIAAGHNSVIGLNRVGLRKAGLTQDQRRELHHAFNLLYRAGLNVTQALERAEQISWSGKGSALFDFVANSRRRGLCDIRKPRHAWNSQSIIESLLMERAVSMG